MGRLNMDFESLLCLHQSDKLYFIKAAFPKKDLFLMGEVFSSHLHTFGGHPHERTSAYIQTGGQLLFA